jgi:hypothetical protein
LPVGADAGVGDHRIAADRVGAAGKRETSGTREQRGDGQAAAEDAGAACLYERARARAIADDGAAAAARSDDQLARGKKIDSGPAAFAADLEPAGKVGGRFAAVVQERARTGITDDGVSAAHAERAAAEIDRPRA